MKKSELWSILKETGKDWSDDNASRLAAALAYYSLLSLAPLIVISIAVAGFFLGDDAARGKVAGELGAIVSGPAAEGINSVVEARGRRPPASSAPSSVSLRCFSVPQACSAS